MIPTAITISAIIIVNASGTGTRPEGKRTPRFLNVLPVGLDVAPVVKI